MKKIKIRALACAIALFFTATGIAISNYSSVFASKKDVNPIRNPGFEADFDGWTLKNPSNKDITVSNSFYSGKKALQIVKTENELSQRVKVNANTNYDLAFYGIYSGPSDGGAIIEIFGEDGEMLLKGIRTPYKFDIWYQKTVSFDSDANQFVDIVIKNTLGGTFLLDDLTLLPQMNYPNHLKNPGYASPDLDMWVAKSGGGSEAAEGLDFDIDDPWVSVVKENEKLEGIDVIPASEEFEETDMKSIKFVTTGSGNEIRQNAAVLNDTEYILGFKYKNAVKGLSVIVLSDTSDVPLINTEISGGDETEQEEGWYTFERTVNSGSATTLTVIFRDTDTGESTQIIREVKLLRIFAGLRTEVIVDPQTGRKIHAIGASNFVTQHGYITSMDWSADSKKMVMYVREVLPKEDYFQNESVKPDSTRVGDRPNYFVLHDTEKDRNIFLDYTDSNNGMADSKNGYYYRSFPRSWTIFRTDLETFERRMIVDQSFAAPLSVTNDGSTLGIQLGSSSVISIDTKTREHKEVIKPTFPGDPVTGFNHTIINPIFPNLIHYIHDNAISGGNGDIDDRLWVADANTGKHELWYQQRDEWSIHHIWAADGKGMYFCNLFGSWTGPTGIMYVPDGGIPNGTWAELINDDHKYLHISVSPDGRYIVADNQFDKEVDPKGNYKIILVDLETRQSELLAQFDFNLKHSGSSHAHPTFSWDSKKVTFTYDIGGILYSAYIDLDEEKGEIVRD